MGMLSHNIWAKIKARYRQSMWKAWLNFEGYYTDYVLLQEQASYSRILSVFPAPSPHFDGHPAVEPTLIS